jgi:hypothetical protein
MRCFVGDEMVSNIRPDYFLWRICALEEGARVFFVENM